MFARDRDDSAASWHLEDVVPMMGYCQELGQGRIPKDVVLGNTNVGDVEVNELGAVAVALPKGNRKAGLPYRNRGTISDS